MLNIYYGRESVDKERFIYRTIAERGYGPGKRTIVIVPDQYTLEAERQAFKTLGVESLIGLDVFSMSRLGHNILAELGGGKTTFIDKYGRQMLLTKIAREVDDDLLVFRGNMAKSSFIEMTNNFISEMKQYDATPETLSEIMDSIDENTLLYKKLADLKLIYERYQNEIEGKYTDSEDLIDLYINKIGQSGLVCDSEVWVYGFDSFAPKFLEVIKGIMAAARQVNVVLTWDKNCRDQDLFDLTTVIMSRLRDLAAEAGCGMGEMVRILDISGEYMAETRSPGIATLEHELFAVDYRAGEDSSGVTLVEAANLYNEAESAAAYILRLLRDEGLRYRDIVVICNDQKLRASIISRVFDEYGLELFSDTKRKILNSNTAVFIVSLLAALGRGYSSTDIFKALKTGMTDMSDEDIEKLENYSLKYRIRGSMWKKTFEKGAFEYGEEGLAEIEGLRQKTMTLFTSLEEIYEKKQTVADFVESFYLYLENEVHIEEKLQEFKAVESQTGLSDLADETEQIWAEILGIFDQMVELEGEDEFDGQEFTEMLTVGLDQIEVGILPTTADDMMMGTMQRTRAGDIKAMVILGANEGILPAEAGDDGLFAEEELEKMAEGGHEICRVEKVRLQEEKLAIYRNLAKPTKYLWVSYSIGDESGSEIRPSDIIDEIEKILPSVTLERDILNGRDSMAMVGGPMGTLRHLTEAMRSAGKGEPVDPVWKSVDQWYETRLEPEMGQIDEGFAFENRTSDLKGDAAEILMKKDDQGALTLSPSRVETFARCPFAHFVTYGLKPEERRVFEVASREIGDVYHLCLMEATRRLSLEGTWGTITRQQCTDMVSAILEKEALEYRDGLFGFSNEEKYKSKRIENTCTQALWALVQHARAGKIGSSRYEISFGRGKSIPPIEIDVDGNTIYIEGKIDRLDDLENGRIKIIDYKSGNLKLSQKEIMSGYKLQLMLYMKAARREDSLPAGVFYFHIQDPRIKTDGIKKSGSDLTDAIAAEIRKQFKLNGIMVNDPDTVKEIDGAFQNSSEIAPVKINKDGSFKGQPADSLVTDEGFQKLTEAVDEKVADICSTMAHGGIDIHPMKVKDSSLCEFCGYKSICRFDLGFDGCKYNMVR